MLSVFSSCSYRILLLLICCFGFQYTYAQQTKEEYSLEEIAVLNKGAKFNTEGFLLLEQGAPEEAKVYFRKAIALDSSNINYFYNLGNACYLTKDWPLALEFYSKAIRVMPHEPDLYYFRAEIYNKQALYNKAIDDFSSAIRLGSGDDPMELLYLCYFSRGVAYLKLQKFNEAIKDFTETLKLDETHYGAFANRGMARYNTKDKFGACEDWQNAYGLGYEKIATQLSKYCK